MDELKVIGWMVWVWISVFLVFEFVGIRGSVIMYPGSKRWWQFPAQIASLVFFMGAILCHPF